MTMSSPIIHGISLTPLTQCSHWFSALDIIAIKMKCCNEFYACISCHAALTKHNTEVWKKDERGEKALFCGSCKSVLSIEEYMAGDGKCEEGNEKEREVESRCPKCNAGWNPGCKNHWNLYFEI
ncbi:zinc finger CHY domain-containing protein [Lophium mytilinum]|uniref:Zinc finger CHY domain-containing protein n=1 Tax=Lophium mytilinum TaxID=390894 RepID=A0A6A6QC79_9PEZI|nr:zinc finger CHY domain-containing protein [Lophium mytilinum]